MSSMGDMDLLGMQNLVYLCTSFYMTVTSSFDYGYVWPYSWTYGSNVGHENIFYIYLVCLLDLQLFFFCTIYIRGFELFPKEDVDHLYFGRKSFDWTHEKSMS